MAVIDIIKELDKDGIDEEQVGRILRELKENGMSVEYYFVDSQKLWQTVITCGNDLQYYGSGKTLALALSNGLSDWFLEYDCE